MYVLSKREGYNSDDGAFFAPPDEDKCWRSSWNIGDHGDQELQGQGSAFNP